MRGGVSYSIRPTWRLNSRYVVTLLACDSCRYVKEIVLIGSTEGYVGDDRLLNRTSYLDDRYDVHDAQRRKEEGCRK